MRELRKGVLYRQCLANVLLDEVDKELEKRGHAFVRYADDLNIYVRSKRAGERVMEAMRRLYARLKLRINEAKSKVARATERKFLGFSFWIAPGRKVKLRVASETWKRVKEHVRILTRRIVGQSIAAVCKELGRYLAGWKAYFRIAETPESLRISTNGFATAYGRCNSSTGSEARPSIASCVLAG